MINGTMKLRKLLKGYPSITVKGSKEIEITGISANSKTVSPGNLFVAKRGLTHDGSFFIREAVAAGAVAVLTDIYDPFLENAVQIVYPNVPQLEADLAKHYYQSAADRLLLVGITGTNGKTTCAYLIKHLLEEADTPVGLIGTISWIVGEHEIPALHTTPDLITNHKLFYEMIQCGCKAAVMEVSSHGLEQGRVRGLDFDVAVFTNLTLDHLDYHKTMEGYAAAKAKLFTGLDEGTAVVNVDSPWVSEVVKGCSSKVLTYGLDHDADLKAEDIILSAKGTQCTIVYDGRRYPFSTSLIGRFNVYNCLAALGAALRCGLEFEKSLLKLRTFKRVPGRLERVPNQLKFDIFVDYAHTDDALKNVLETLREIKKGRVITVFGCGGNRDTGKRVKMGEIAEELSDFVVITTDNPRQEDPHAIIREILVGIKDRSRVILEPDRRTAIEKAVDLCRPDDILLIAGKGHETYQIFAHKTIDFDDRKIASEACEKICASFL
jgi:UDP-N-acetylmuramoyl-L-alanyl-D-glutamate--2,6-diaminopimelate ligase